MRAWEHGTDFRELLRADPEVEDALLEDAFNLARSLRNVDQVFQQLAGVREL
jgi:hypothetical protein